MRKEQFKDVYNKMEMSAEEGERVFQKIIEGQSGSKLNSAVRLQRAMKIAAAVLAFCLLVPGTVYAAKKAYEMHVEQKGKYQADMIVEKEKAEKINTDELYYEEEVGGDMIDANGTVNNVSDVRMIWNYIPDDMKADGSWLEEKKQTEDSRSYVSELYRIDTAGFTLSIFENSESEKVEWEQCEGLVVRNDFAWNHSTLYRAYLYYDEIGYLLKLTGDADKEELLKVAKGISFKKDTGKNRTHAQAWSEKLKDDEMDEAAAVAEAEEEKKRKETPLALDLSKNHGVGTTVPYASGYEVTLDKVSVQNHAKGLNLAHGGVQNHITGRKLDRTCLNKDGSLKGLVRHYFKAGDGVDSLDQEIGSEELPLRILRVDVTLTSKKPAGSKPTDVTLSPVLHLLQEKNGKYVYRDPADAKDADYVHDEDENSLRVPGDGSANGMAQLELLTSESNSDITGKDLPEGYEYVTDVKPGESRKVTMYFGILEEELEHVCLEMCGPVNGVMPEIHRLKETDSYFKIF